MQQQAARTLRVASAFEEGGAVPRRFTCDGKDVSPPLTFAGAPPGTRTLAVVFDDPDAPKATWVHWAFWNWPAARLAVPEGADLAAAGAVLGANSWGNRAYGGPCPPRGQHRYVVKVYALDTELALPAGSTVPELERAMDGHVLAWGMLTGTYARG